MEEKIIVAVCGYPVLYDPSSPFYRDRTEKDKAWVNVSRDVGFSVDVCRKRWKGLRDVYLRERKKEGEMRSGSAGGEPAKKWRFSAVMSFLDPFVMPRPTSGNMALAVEEDMTAESSSQGQREAGDESAAVAGPSSAAVAGPSSAAVAGPSSAAVAGPSSSAAVAGPSSSAAVAGPSSSAAGPEAAAAAINDQSLSDTDGAVPTVIRTPGATQRRKKRSRLEEVREAERQREERMEQLLEQSLRAPPQSEEESFLLSLVPSLQKLEPHRRDYIKYMFCKLLYEESTTVTLNMELLE